MPNLIGKKAPNFILSSTSGKVVELGKIKSNMLFYIFIQKMTHLVAL